MSSNEQKHKIKLSPWMSKWLKLCKYIEDVMKISDRRIITKFVSHYHNLAWSENPGIDNMSQLCVTKELLDNDIKNGRVLPILENIRLCENKIADAKTINLSDKAQ